MKPLAVVIPSRTASNLVPCIAAVRQHEPEARIIVVDDGLQWTAKDDDGKFILNPKNGDVFLMGESPFVFARNVNIGIIAAGDADVVLLNDDALLESPGGFSLMQQAAEENPGIGLIGATTDVSGSVRQMRSAGGGIRGVDHIAFVCVLIPWRTRQKLATKSTASEVAMSMLESCVDRPDWARTVFTDGFLDERYVTYGWEDNDYIRQCKTAGLQIAVHDGCYVNHSKLPSTFRSKGGPGGDIEPGRKIYMAKWPGFRQ